MPAAVKEKAIQKVRAGMPDITEDQVTGDVKGKSFRLFTWTTNAKARKLLENCNLNVKIDFAFGQAGPGTLVNLFKTALTERGLKLTEDTTIGETLENGQARRYVWVTDNTDIGYLPPVNWIATSWAGLLFLVYMTEVESAAFRACGISAPKEGFPLPTALLNEYVIDNKDLLRHLTAFKNRWTSPSQRDIERLRNEHARRLVKAITHPKKEELKSGDAYPRRDPAYDAVDTIMESPPGSPVAEEQEEDEAGLVGLFNLD